MGMENTIVDGGAPVRHLITVEEFLILDRAGAFEGVGRIQLIDGEMYNMSPIHRPHALAQASLLVAFVEAVRRSGLALDVFAPVSSHLDDHNLPEPDLVLATIEDDDYVSRNSIRLALEVSDRSLSFDLGKKAALYARTGVPEYWVVDLNGRAIVRMADPADDSYRQRDIFAFGEAISSITLPAIIVDTRSLA